MKLLAAKAFISLVLATLLAAGLLLKAQSGRTYAVGLDWWGAGRGAVFPLQEQYDDPSGELTVLNTKGMLKPQGHPFFEALGSNGRACITCHQPSGAMSVAADRIRQRWLDTQGTDPIFTAIDGSNCPDLPQADPKSHSLLLHRGLFRMALPWPPKAATGAVILPDFRIDVVRDPTGCNTNAQFGLRSPHPSISVFRRPRVVANFKYAIAADPAFALMADGREPSLRSQAVIAALVHEQAAVAPTGEQLDRIVEFEMQVFVAQSAHSRTGLLYGTDNPAMLAPENLASGTASLLAGVASTLKAKPDFVAWQTPQGRDHASQFKASVARGSNVFETHCASCHQDGRAASRAININTTIRKDSSQTSELPLFRITCDNSSVIYTEDPGRALITGKCADVGAIVMQQMRGLSARAPYFSNGSAQTLDDVVDYYDRQFSIGFSAADRDDLVSFLSVL